MVHGKSVLTLILLLGQVSLIFGSLAAAQTILGNVNVGDNPIAAATDPVLNKIYVVNADANSVTAISEFTNSTTTISVGAAPAAVAVNPATGNVYVANAGDGTVTVINGVTNTVAATINTGRSPIALGVNSVTNQIYVVNQGDNTVTLINGATGATNSIPVGAMPVAVAVNPVNNMVYIANQKSNDITVLNGTSGTTATVAVGASPSTVAVNPTTNVVYVVNRGNNTVTALNGNTSSTATISVGSAPESVAINPVTNKIYVPSSQDGSVTVIDGATNTTATVSVGVLPLAIAVNSLTDKIYVANNGSGQTSSGADLVSVIDGATNAVTNVAGSGGSTAIALDPKSDRIYMPDTASAAAVVIEGATNSTASIPVGSEPGAIAYNPVTGTVFICNFAGNSLTLLDTASNTTTTVPVGNAPSAVAVNPVTNRAYVTNSSGGTISVVDAAAQSVVATIPIVYSNLDAIAVNPVTNKIYVAVADTNQLFIIDGASNSTTSMQVGSYPSSLAINPATNRVYVANLKDGTVTVLDGATGETTTIDTIPGEVLVEVNPNTNKIYVANSGGTSLALVGKLVIIDGATNQVSVLTTSTNSNLSASMVLNRQTNRIYVAGGITDYKSSIVVVDGATDTILDSVTAAGEAYGIAVNPISDQIYVSGAGTANDNNMTAIDGATNTPVPINIGGQSTESVVNPVSGKVYALGGNAGITVITPNELQTVPLSMKVLGIVDEQTISTTNLFQTRNPSPSFCAQVASSYTSSGSTFTVNPPPTAVYYQIDGGALAWTKATTVSTSGANPGIFSLALTNIPVGLHTLYLFPAYGDESAGSGIGNGTGDSIQIGNIQGLSFLVEPGGTSTSDSPTSCLSTQPPPPSSPTATSLSSNINPQVLGGSVTFTATVSPSATASTSPTGTVSFFDDTTELGTSPLGSNLTTTYTTSSLTLGNHSITASYSGDANFAGSTSGVLVESIVQPPPIRTTTALSSSANPQVLGSGVTFTGTVSAATAGSQPPTGTVSFFDGATKLGTSTLASNLAATFTTSSLALGSHSITASYSGDTNFASSTSGVLVESIVASTGGSDFSLSVTPSTITMASNQQGTATITATPIDRFQGSVSLTCLNQPAFISCVFQPSQVSLSGSAAQTAQLTLSTIPPAGFTANNSRRLWRTGSELAAAFWFPIGLPASLLFGWKRSRRGRRWQGLLLVGLCSSALGLIGCGVTINGYSGTYKIVVSGSANGGQLTHQTTVTLTLQN